ncbi:hypothetical protein SBADM41S_11910 [Streptomyces badius]
MKTGPPESPESAAGSSSGRAAGGPSSSQTKRPRTRPATGRTVAVYWSASSRRSGPYRWTRGKPVISQPGIAWLLSITPSRTGRTGRTGSTVSSRATSNW